MHTDLMVGFAGVCSVNSNKTMSVLHIIGSSRFGGGTMVAFSLAEMARQHGFKPAMLTDDPETIRLCQERDVEVVEFNGLVRPIRPWADISAARRLRRLLRQRGDTIVHTHTLKGGLIGRIAASRAGVPVIIHHRHGFSFQDDAPLLRKKIIALAERYAAKRCDKVISVNPSDVELAAKWKIGPQEKFVYIPNGINGQKIDAVRPAERAELIKMLKIEQESLLVAVVARLFAEKGHPWLFEAMKDVTSGVKRPVHLILLGDGPHLDRFAKQVRSLGIENCTHFMGFRSDCIAIAKACDLFVLPSLREGHSITILEAMAMGTPIVATDIRGINDSVRHQQEALLVTPRDSQSLAKAIIQILNDTELAERLKNKARERFLAEFTEEKMQQRVWQVYKAVGTQKGVTGLAD